MFLTTLSFFLSLVCYLHFLNPPFFVVINRKNLRAFFSTNHDQKHTEIEPIRSKTRADGDLLAPVSPHSAIATHIY